MRPAHCSFLSAQYARTGRLAPSVQYVSCGPSQSHPYGEHSVNCLATALPGPKGLSVASAVLVLKHNNNIKKDREFEHLLTEGKN